MDLRNTYISLKPDWYYDGAVLFEDNTQYIEAYIKMVKSQGWTGEIEGFTPATCITPFDKNVDTLLREFHLGLDSKGILFFGKRGCPEYKEKFDKVVLWCKNEGEFNSIGFSSTSAKGRMEVNTSYTPLRKYIERNTTSVEDENVGYFNNIKEEMWLHHMIQEGAELYKKSSKVSVIEGEVVYEKVFSDKYPIEDLYIKHVKSKPCVNML